MRQRNVRPADIQRFRQPSFHEARGLAIIRSAICDRPSAICNWPLAIPLGGSVRFRLHSRLAIRLQSPTSTAMAANTANDPQKELNQRFFGLVSKICGLTLQAPGAGLTCDTR